LVLAKDKVTHCRFQALLQYSSHPSDSAIALKDPAQGCNM